jgi:hypothetical protein
MTFDARPYGAKPVVVLSRTTSQLKVPDGVVVRVDEWYPHEIGAQLTQRGMKTSLHRRRSYHTRLSEGSPMPGDIWLEHVATRSYKSGMVQSEYVIAF